MRTYIHSYQMDLTLRDSTSCLRERELSERELMGSSRSDSKEDYHKKLLWGLHAVHLLMCGPCCSSPQCAGKGNPKGEIRQPISNDENDLQTTKG